MADVTSVTLTRNDAARNMHRYYRLDVQPDLFGQWCFIREWGRAGQAGQTRTVPFPTPTEAEAALERHRRAKQRKGYRPAIADSERWHREAGFAEASGKSREFRLYVENEP